MKNVFLLKETKYFGHKNYESKANKKGWILLKSFKSLRIDFQKKCRNFGNQNYILHIN
jgi:hypothetical protein